MGRISQGILGGVSGTIGNVVGGSWKGITYLRVKSDHYNDANSEKQVKQRTKFAACVAFAKLIIDTIIRPIWNKKAVKMSGFNLFTKTNLSAFNADGDIGDYSQLQVSVGDLPLPENIVIADDAETEGGVSITWEDNSGTGSALASDEFRILAISNGEVNVLQDIEITRETESAKVLLPYGAGVEVQVYVFFESVENYIFSPSQHGAVNVT
ncbi:DUF6266 family protein [Roseimarinus sediminis]|uniref:DUF6266 family protein n=1 Tax=Roseimarinus sediminis TaxID=1610899 RepID=UPI003D1FF2D8